MENGYRVFIKQGLKKVQLEEYLRGELNRAGFTELEIVKTPMVTRIIAHVSKPGLAIGKGGQNIRNLTDTIQKQFGIENPQIEIKEITKPELDAKAMIEKMKSLIERGFSFKSVAFKTVMDIERAGALGIELVLAGKIAGKGGRKRKMRIAKGYMKKCGDTVKLVDYAKATSYPKLGAIGLKLRIVRPGTFFADKIDLREYLAKRREGKAVMEASAENTVKVEEKTEAVQEVKKETEKVEVKIEAEVKKEAKESKKKEAKPKAEEKKEAKADEKKDEPAIAG